MRGFYNVVKHVDERRSTRGVQCCLDHIPFNCFIDDNNLVDLPLIGRVKIEENVRSLPSGSYYNEEDWGPRPSRMLKCWKDAPGYNLFVREKWNSFQNLPSKIETLKDRQSVLDQKGEEEDFSGDELVELHGVTVDIHSISRLHASISWQQSRSLWLKKGDANSNVNPIHEAVFSHFASHFKKPNVERPGVDNLQFKRLSHMENSSLTKPFTETEVKLAVWDYDSYKSPGPDGINFGFIKDFWAELRVDVMRFILDFHRNGKLTKDINSTIIALIPKIDSPQRLNDFRPILLVGSLYKILAKDLANRLRLVIGSVIFESQTEFVKDRHILDGILIANEVMERMLFPTLSRKWIRECVCTATASVLVNGSPTDEFLLK
ncbi:cysteine-rich receptor-like protein kinase [Trifolium pratense]|uniref:Cysteine-rich receptor-like protein kinase n=1 Tax=Trifolium pratense TaxID=57577 RepID=A0A2K3LRM5_TRIPR|nr:cysteine-rich receptor-like protein kinase [Trifolium pratense]